MYKRISYILFVLIIGSMILFIFINNKKLEKQKPIINKTKNILNEEDRINLIFKNEMNEKKSE